MLRLGDFAFLAAFNDGGGLGTGPALLIAILGVVVGGIVIAMYLPIFDLISKLT